MDIILYCSSFMLVNIKKLVPEAVLPLYAKVGDAGMDLVATSVDHSNEYYIEYGTGLAVEIPEGYVGLIFPRSSNSKKDLQLCNSVGVIDSGYRGEIKLRYRRIINPTPKRNFVVTDVQWQEELDSNTPIQRIKADFSCYGIGDKVGQIIIMPIPFITFIEVQELSETVRGDGGFGSTGK